MTLVRLSGEWVATGLRRYGPLPPVALTRQALAVAATAVDATLTIQLLAVMRQEAPPLAGAARATTFSDMCQAAPSLARLARGPMVQLHQLQHQQLTMTLPHMCNVAPSLAG